MKSLDAALGLVANTEDSELLIRVILLLINLSATRLLIHDLLRIIRTMLLNTTWNDLDALVSVEIRLSQFDLLSSCLINSHLVEDESTKKREEEDDDEAGCNENDHHGSVVASLNNSDVSILNINDGLIVID